MDIVIVFCKNIYSQFMYTSPINISAFARNVFDCESYV